MVVSAVHHLDTVSLPSDWLSIVLGGCAQLYTNTPLVLQAASLWKSQLTGPMDVMKAGYRALFIYIKAARWSLKSSTFTGTKNYLNLPHFGAHKVATKPANSRHSTRLT